jgi:predicted dehydrogenase
MSQANSLPLSSSPISRRTALQRGLAGVLAFGVAPSFVPTRLFGRTAPSNRIMVGLIGNGLICSAHVGSLLRKEDCRIVALCDVWKKKSARMKDRIEKAYGEANGGTGKGVDTYQYHEELLARDDIDAVFVTTPDHWHAPLSLAAMKAGKDVYCEKPLTLTVREGRILVDAARRYGRVLQTGTQQRSESAFRKAAEIIRNGWIGEVRGIRTRLGEFPQPVAYPAEPVPADLDYDRWLGPTPWRPFNSKRILGDYSGGWRNYFEYGGRKNGDWGAHHFDIIQWALGMDDSGPVEFIPIGWQGTRFQTHVYANGVRVERDDKLEGKAMIEFTGTKGVVKVARGNYLETTPTELASRPLRPDEAHLYVSADQQTDFFNAIRTRQRPISDVEIGHRSATVGHLANIAFWLQQPIKWDPTKEEIVGNKVAARYLDRPRRAPYGLG